MRWWTVVALGALAACSGGKTPTEFEGDDPGECIDGADNDQDGLFDCDDDDCSDAPDCQPVSIGEG